MEQLGDWVLGRKLGEGGQGAVHHAYRRAVMDGIASQISNIASMHLSHGKDAHARGEGLITRMREVIANPQQAMGALKKLRPPGAGDDAEKAKERLRKEIEAMALVDHQNFVRLLDRDPENKWYVMEFFEKGTLTPHLSDFTANPIKTLRALQPMIEAVSRLHAKGAIHRDIKPDNIFLSDTDALILGDPGIVFFKDEPQSRVTSTIESVGSGHWMPPWAVGVRLEDCRPSFDVFSLGKMIYVMVSNNSILPFWEHKRAENNLEQMFDGDSRMKRINGLLDRCIVREEKDCLPDTDSLLDEVKRALSEMEGSEAESVVRATLQASREERREALRGATGPEAPRGSLEDTLRQLFERYVDEFTEWHVRILKLYSEPGPAGERAARAGPMFQRSHIRLLLNVAYEGIQGSEEIQDRVWKDLYNRGLVASKDLEETFEHGGSFGRQTTEHGEQFLRFLKGS